MTRWPALVLLLWLGAPLTDRAEASTQTSLDERHCAVAVEMNRGHATVVVQRRFVVRRPRLGGVDVNIDVPSGAAVIGLRLRAGAAGRWRPAALRRPHDEAIERIERHETIDRWLLRIDSVPRNQPITIELTLLVGTRYTSGAHGLSIDGLKPDACLDNVRISTAQDRDRVRRHERGAFLLEPADAPAMEATVAEERLAAGRFLQRLRISAAPELAHALRPTALAVLIDASRSLSPAERALAISGARAIVSRLAPETKVHLVLFDRSAKPQFPTAVRPAEAETALAELRFEPGNGSDLFAALSLADQLLADGPGGHRMVLAFTDLATGLVDPESRYADCGALPRSRASLNIVSVRETAAALSPWDGARSWHAVAPASGGLLWKAPQSGGATASDWSALSEPTCIRGLRIVDANDRPIELGRECDDGDEGSAASVNDELCQGEGGGLLQLGAVPWRWVTIEGQLGGERIKARVLPSAREARVWSALAVHRLEDDLSSRDSMQLARRGHELSPAPADVRIGMPAILKASAGSHVARAFAQQPSLRANPQPAPAATGFHHGAWLHDRLGVAWSRCGGSGRGRIALETTRDEVLAVRFSSELQNRAADSCLTEAAWALRLPGAFTSGWARWVVELGGGRGEQPGR